MSKQKTSKTKNQPLTPNREEVAESGEYHLPIEPKSSVQAAGGSSTRRLLILLSLGLGMGAALLIWWLGTNL